MRNKPQQKQVLIDDGKGGQVLAWEHTECVDCDDPLEPERLALASIRCVSCQTIVEEREKKYGRF